MTDALLIRNAPTAFSNPIPTSMSQVPNASATWTSHRPRCDYAIEVGPKQSDTTRSHDEFTDAYSHNELLTATESHVSALYAHRMLHRFA